MPSSINEFRKFLVLKKIFKIEFKMNVYLVRNKIVKIHAKRNLLLRNFITTVKIKEVERPIAEPYIYSLSL